MPLPFRRRRRERQLHLKGNFPATDKTIGELIEQVRPADYNGTTYPYQWGGASEPGQPRGSVIPPGPVALKQTGRDTHPFAFRGQPRYAPPAALPAPVPDRPALPAPARRPALAIAAAETTPAEDALASLTLEVKRLASRGQLDRVSDEKLNAMEARRRDKLKQPRDTAKLIVDKAVDLLRAGHAPQHPDGAA